MKPGSLFFKVVFCLLSLNTTGQDTKWEFSKPLDLREAGVNKVLCMKNGNTLLFHFEPAKKINVIVFDNSHKETANRKDNYRLLDIALIEYATFKGLYEINGEAVLFIDQDRNGKHCLVMLRYEASGGKLLEERLVGESKGENRRIKFYVIKNKEDDNYEVLFCMDKRHPKQNDMYVVFFNKTHQSVKEVQLEINRKKYDYLEVVGAESQQNGVLITISLEKTVVYGRASDLDANPFGRSDHDSALVEGGPVFDHYLTYYFIPKDSSRVKRGLLDVSQAVFPYYSIYTYNAFADALNLLLFSFKPVLYRFGLYEITSDLSSSLFLKIDASDMSAGLTIVRNGKAGERINHQKDSSGYFEGIPLKMFTNENGLTTLISQSYKRYGELESNDRFDYEAFLGNIGITQFDDNGNEIWGTALPLSQYFFSNRGYFNVKDLCKRWQDQNLFGDLPAQVYDRQFISLNSCLKGKSWYLIYNDYNKNFNNSLTKPGDTVYSFNNTNAFYYKVEKKEISKHYLFGEPAPNDYKCSFIEGADYDEQRGLYVTLVQHKKNEKVTLCMAWRLLD